MALDDIQAFVAVGRALSFSAAGRRLRIPRSTLSKQIMRLEERLGVRLLQRTTRTVSLTDTGIAFLERCERALEDIEDAERAAMDATGRPQGELRVAMSVDAARDLISPLLADFHARYPEVSLRLVVDQRRVNVIADGFDVAIRGGPQSDASLIARTLVRGDLVVCASPGYLNSRGRPARLSDLANHDLVTIPHPVSEQLLGLDAQALQKRSWLVANEWGVLGRAIVDGLGIGLLPELAFRVDFEGGRLERILPEVGVSDALYAVYPSRHHLSRKVRVFVDFLVERLAR